MAALPSWAHDVLLLSSTTPSEPTVPNAHWSKVSPCSDWGNYWQNVYRPFWSDCVLYLMRDAEDFLHGQWGNNETEIELIRLMRPHWIGGPGWEGHETLVDEAMRRYRRGRTVDLPAPVAIRCNPITWRRQAAINILKAFEPHFKRPPTCPDWLCCGGCKWSKDARSDVATDEAWLSFPMDDGNLTHDWEFCLERYDDGRPKTEHVRVTHALPRSTYSREVEMMELCIRAYMVTLAMEPDEWQQFHRTGMWGPYEANCSYEFVRTPPRIPLPVMMDMALGSRSSGNNRVERAIIPDPANAFDVWLNWFPMVAGLPAPGCETREEIERIQSTGDMSNWELFRAHPWRWWQTTRAIASETRWIDESLAKYLWERSPSMPVFPAGAIGWPRRSANQKP